MSRALLSVLLVAATLIPAVGHAVPPKRAEVDDALLRLEGTQKEALSAARADLDAAEEARRGVEHDLEVAKAEEKVCRAWAAVAAARVAALDEEIMLADARRDQALLAELARARVVALEGQMWRKERQRASVARVAHEQARLAWAKADEDRLQQGWEVRRLEGYQVVVGPDPKVDIEIGRAQSKFGRLGAQEARKRLKVERTLEEWTLAVRDADSLRPEGEPVLPGVTASR